MVKCCVLKKTSTLVLPRRQQRRFSISSGCNRAGGAPSREGQPIREASPAITPATTHLTHLTPRLLLCPSPGSIDPLSTSIPPIPFVSRVRATVTMPPKLAGYTIALSGTFRTTQATIQSTITSLGGEVAKSVNADTTILISTAADVKKNSKKVQDATSNSVPIVSIDWLDETEQAKGPATPDDFLLVNASPPTATAKGKAKKRAASPDVAAAPVANTRSKGKKRAASPDVAVPPAAKVPKANPAITVPKLEPKVGEGSVLKSRNVNIPLDEGCPLQTYHVYIDPNGVVFDASLNRTDASNNNNKFYRVQVCLEFLAQGKSSTDTNSFSRTLLIVITKPGHVGDAWVSWVRARFWATARLKMP